MDNHIDPKITAILKQLDDMKDSVIVAGRSAADHDKESHAMVKALRCELEALKDHIKKTRESLQSESKIAEASTISMIAGWCFAAVCFAGWMLS